MNAAAQKLTNWTIKVYTDVATPVFVASTSTDANGAYTFDLQPGDYLLFPYTTLFRSQSAPSGTDCSGISGVAAGGFKLTVTSSGTSAGNDFGNYTTGSVSGVKFEDHNANGVKNVGDQGLANWTIKVYTDAATPVFVASTTTDANGAYSFDLQPGDYLVCEVLKSLYTQSAPSGTD